MEFRRASQADQYAHLRPVHAKFPLFRMFVKANHRKVNDPVPRFNREGHIDTSSSPD